MPHRQPWLFASGGGPFLTEHEVHLVAVSPRVAHRRSRQHRPCSRCVVNGGTHETIDDRGFQPELFRVGNVLPGAAAARAGSRRRRPSEMPARRCDTMRRGAHDLEKAANRETSSRGDKLDANPFAWQGERNRDADARGLRDAVTGGTELFDVDGDDSCAGQLTARSSTSKTSVAFGGITPPAPCAP